MSDMIDLITEMLGDNSALQDKSNPMHVLLDYTVGEWLQRQEDETFFEQFFLQDATGAYLDLHGKDYGVLRKIDESDDDYRERIILESLGHLTIPYLIKVYNVELYYNISDFDVSDNTLTSDNPYIVGSDGFMAVAPSLTVKNILNKKFILGEGLRWL